MISPAICMAKNKIVIQVQNFCQKINKSAKRFPLVV